MRLVLIAVVTLSSVAVMGCGVSKSTLEEEIEAAKTAAAEDATKKAADAEQRVKEVAMKRIIDIESNFATRTAMDEAIRKSQVKTLDECDKKLQVLEGQMAEIKKKVEVVNMANRGELLKILDTLRAMTVSMVGQLKTQRDAIDQAIKQLEGFSVPEMPEDDKDNETPK